MFALRTRRVKLGKGTAIYEPRYIGKLQSAVSWGECNSRYFMYEDASRAAAFGVMVKIPTFTASFAFRKIMANRGAYYKNLYGGGRR